MFQAHYHRNVLAQDATTCKLGELTFIGAIEQGRGVVPASPLRRYGKYALVLITRGEGVYLDANARELAVKAGDAITVFPELAHTYSPLKGTTWDEIFAVFDGPLFDACRAMGILSIDRPVAATRDSDRCAQRLQALAQMRSGASPASKSAQICKLLELLTDLADSGSPGPPDEREASNWLIRACSALASDLDSPVSVCEISQSLGMSQQTFQKRFRREVGLPPARFRSLKKIEAASDMLQYTSMTLAQIAARLGFTDEFHFSKRFKQAVGLSPRQFREREFSR